MAEHTIYGASAPTGTYSAYSDGGSVIKLSAAFRTSGSTGSWTCKGGRVWIPSGASVPGTITIFAYSFADIPWTGGTPAIPDVTQMLKTTYTQSKSVSVPGTGQWVQAVWDTPFSITDGQPFYIGYTFNSGHYIHTSGEVSTAKQAADSSAFYLTAAEDTLSTTHAWNRCLFNIDSGTTNNATPNTVHYGIDAVVDDGVGGGTAAGSATGSWSVSGSASGTNGGGAANITIGNTQTAVLDAATSLAVTKPTGLADGHVVVTTCGTSGTGGVVPTGFTEIGRAQTSASQQVIVAYKVISNAAGEPATYTWTGLSGRTSIAATGLSGVDNSTPLDVSASTATGSGSVNVSTTTATDNALVYAAAIGNWSTDAMTVPASMTQLFNLGNPGRRTAGATLLKATAGATGTLTFTGTSGLAMAGLAFAFKASGAGGGGGAGGTVTNLWVGGVTTSGATVAAKVSGGTTATLKVSTASNLSNPISSSGVGIDANGLVKMSVTGLSANTLYYYGVDIDGTVDTATTGQFRTAPSGAANFNFVFGSCADSGGSPSSFTRALARNPELAFITGDFHYEDPASETEFRSAYDMQLGGTQGDMLSQVPTAYTWSDHDWSNVNNGGAAAPTNAAANAVYRSRVPHWTLASGTTTGIYQTFVWGRVRFIVTDERSFKSDNAAADNSSKTMLGSTQKQWLKDTITAATEPVIFWVGDTPWNGAAATPDDEWFAYNTERQELATFFQSSGKNIIRISGDMHAVAADDGTNSPGGIPILHAAPWNKEFSNKAGPYTSGPYPTSGTGLIQQYGHVDIADDGTNVTVTFTGYDSSDVARATWSDTFTAGGGGGGEPGEVIVNSASGIAGRNGTSAHTVPFGFTPSSGNLLVFVVGGPVTHANGEGWTERLAPVNSTELSVFTKTSNGTETSINITHNGSNYPVVWAVYEVNQGTWLSGSGDANTGTPPALTGLPGVDGVIAFTALSRGPGLDGAATASAVLDAGWVEDVDSIAVGAATDGAYVIAGHLETTATSVTPTITPTYGGSGWSPNAQAVSFAVQGVRVASGPSNGIGSATGSWTVSGSASGGANIKRTIAQENQLPGTPSSAWTISGAGQTANAGFVRGFTVHVGQTANFSVTGTATKIDIYRIGYYGGDGWRLYATVDNTPVTQPAPAIIPDSNGGTTCEAWSTTATWGIPANATPGLYVGVVRDASNTQASRFWVPFIVRDEARNADIVYKTSDATWALAYNAYGGKNIYGSGYGTAGTGTASWDIENRAHVVSYMRPITTRGPHHVTYWMNAEYPMIRYMERNGFDVTYLSCVDLDRDPTILDGHKIFISNGHDEYWSQQMRDTVESFRDTGGHCLFMSGNEVFWRTRFSANGQDMWCYKDTMNGPGAHVGGTPLDPVTWTGTYKDTRWANREPENLITGTDFRMNGILNLSPTLETAATYADHTVWRNTTLPTQNLSLTGVVGFEADRMMPTVPVASQSVMAADDFAISGYWADDNGQVYTGNGTLTWGIVSQRWESGAVVVGFGTVQWSWALDNSHDNGGAYANINVQQMMVNLFVDLGASPSTPMTGVTVTSASSLDNYGAMQGIPVPTGLSAVPLSTTEVLVNWDDVPGATGYDVERDGLVVASNVAVSTYTDTGLEPGTTYTYRVRAVG